MASANSEPFVPNGDADHRRVSAAHEESEAKLKLGISVAGFGLGAMDYLKDTITLDATAAALFDFPANVEISRQDLHKRFDPECALEIAREIRAVLDPAGDGFMALEHQVVRPDGGVLWLAARKQVEFAVDPASGRKRAVTGLLAVRDITARRTADQKLRVSEIRYRRLFEAAHDGVLLVDPTTSMIVDANPFMTRLLGYSHEQLVGKELFEIGLMADRDTSQDMVRKLKTDRHVRYEDLPLRSIDGVHREVEVVANLYDEDGHAIIQCNIRDITARKIADAAALQNSRLFSTLIDQAPSGVYVVDAAFRLVQVNPLAIPIFASVQPLLGRDFSEVLGIVWGPELGPEIAAIFKHTLASGERYVAPEFTADRHDIGVKQTYEWEAQRVTLADASYGVVCYFNDITKRKHTEDAVAEREAHVRSILDNTQAFIGLLSLDGTLLEANAPALQAAGIKRESVIGRRLWDIEVWSEDPGEVARLKDAIVRAARGEIVRYDLVVHLAHDVHLDIDFMIAPVRDASGTITLLVPSGLDVTDRKRSLRHIHLLMGEVNHRAMNLLAVVQAVARQTARHGDAMTFVTRLTERIASLAASQNLLVQNEWQGVAVMDLVAAQLSHFNDLIGTRVIFDGPTARLSAAAAQGIGMALHELATNAGKYGALSNDAGRVQVLWRTTATDPAMFEMRWIETAGPMVEPPTRQGFGQKVMGPMVEASVTGKAEIDYCATGLTWTLIAPISEALELERGAM
jgi:PAS domain S-box-containing protein